MNSDSFRDMECYKPNTINSLIKKQNEISPCYGSTLKTIALPSHTISDRALHPSLLVPTTEF